MLSVNVHVLFLKKIFVVFFQAQLLTVQIITRFLPCVLCWNVWCISIYQGDTCEDTRRDAEKKGVMAMMVYY